MEPRSLICTSTQAWIRQLIRPLGRGCSLALVCPREQGLKPWFAFEIKLLPKAGTCTARMHDAIQQNTIKHISSSKEKENEAKTDGSPHKVSSSHPTQERFSQDQPFSAQPPSANPSSCAIDKAVVDPRRYVQLWRCIIYTFEIGKEGPCLLANSIDEFSEKVM